MATEIEKPSVFVLMLLSNHTLQSLSPIQKEEQILQFLQVNSAQLYPTLSSDNFFPGKSWEKIYQMLAFSLQNTINDTLLPNINKIINDSIDLSFIQILSGRNVPYQKVKEDLNKFIVGMLKNQNARRDFSGSYTALFYEFIDKYIDEVFKRKSYVYFELIKVQKLKMNKEEIKNIIKVAILLRPLIYIFSGVDLQKSADGSTVIKSRFAEKICLSAKNKILSIPEQIIKSAVYSNVSFMENKYIETTSRITSIFAQMCRNFRPNLKIDRGADTPDKSWINTARRNYKYYGFDLKMLDEFYKISAENRW